MSDLSSQSNQSNQPNSVFKQLLCNFTKYLDSIGIDTQELQVAMNNLETCAMFLRLKIKPIVDDERALTALIPSEIAENFSDEQKNKCNRFLSALCELV